MRFYQSLAALAFVVFIFFFSSCLTSKKFDKFVADQYNNEIPKPDNKKRKTEVAVASAIPSASSAISTTEPHTKVLPLILYWKIDYRHTCSLNSQIALTNFTNTVNAMANKTLVQKLNGQKLELTVEQVPSQFALVEKTHAIWLIYVIHWDKIYIEPEVKNLVVSYKLMSPDNNIKTGQIVVIDTERSKNLRLFQSWKSATSDYIVNYNANVTDMSKQFVNQLNAKL